MRKRHSGFTPLMLFVACAGAACTSVGATTPPTLAPLTSNSFVVRNVRVFDGDRVIERTNVVVRRGRIASVGKELPSELPLLDGSGCTLLPGLIDAHGHVQNEDALRNALRFGVTTQLDQFTRVDFARAHRAKRDRMTQTDLADLYSAGTPVTSARGMGTQFGMTFSTIGSPNEASSFVRARLAEGSDYIKILYEPDAGIVTTISAETLAAVVAAAHAHGALAVVHVTSSPGVRAVVAAGADGFAHFVGDSLLDESLIRQIAAQKMFVIPTLSLFASIDDGTYAPGLAADTRIAPFLTSAQRASLMAVRPKGGPGSEYLARFSLKTASENVRRLAAAGVSILAGDDVPTNGTFGASLHGELELLTRAGLTPIQALRAATSAPADAFRLAGRGRITPGSRADLVLVQGNPLGDITASRSIIRVFKNGYEVPRAEPAKATN